MQNMFNMMVARVLAGAAASVVMVGVFILVLFVLPRPLPGIPAEAPKGQDGIYEKNYWIGTPEARGQVLDGRVQGGFVQFYPNGSLYRLLQYSAGRLNGEAREFHEMPTRNMGRRRPADTPDGLTGPVKAVWNYSDGVREGPYRFYALNGELIEEGEYRNGKRLWKRRLSSQSSFSLSSFTR